MSAVTIKQSFKLDEELLQELVVLEVKIFEKPLP